MFFIHPGKKTLACDEIMNLEIIQKDFPDLETDMNGSLGLWTSRINIIPESNL